MNLVYILLAAGIALALLGALVIVLMSAGSKNRDRHASNAHTRHIARQPWDAHGRVR